MCSLHVEYAERRGKYDILFIFSLFCENINLEYVAVPVINRDDQTEYVIHILVATSQEHVNTYSTRRMCSPGTRIYRCRLALRANPRCWPVPLCAQLVWCECMLAFTRDSFVYSGILH